MSLIKRITQGGAIGLTAYIISGIVSRGMEEYQKGKVYDCLEECYKSEYRCDMEAYIEANDKYNFWRHVNETVYWGILK